jgi:hypothetical protein
MKWGQRSGEQHLETWFRTHAGRFALVVVLLGFLARLWTASGTYLNPDEAMHFLAAYHASLAGAYRGSLGLAHPPLLILLLYYWRNLGESELMLRLPSVLAGTGFCWFSFRWLTAVFGRSTGWIGLVFASLLPPLIGLSAEVRQYALLLGFVAASAFFLEQALTRSSASNMAYFAICLYLSILSHYSAMLFAGAIGLYSLLRLIGSRPSRAVVVSWAVAQAGALALLLVLYRTHIAQLKGSGVAQQAMQEVMRNSYYHAGQDHWPLFVFARTFGVFQFIFGQNAIGDVAGVLFFIGVILLLRGKIGAQESINPGLLATFLLLPFAINGTAALADFYPYGGTRHSAFLAMFAIAGAALPLAKWSGDRIIRALGGALLIVVACYLFGAPHRPYMRRSDQRETHMVQAMETIRRQVAAGAPIFVDPQTSLLLRRYLCPEASDAVDTTAPRLQAYACAGHPVVVARSEAWIISAPQFLDRWRDVLSVTGMRPGDRLFVFQAGWDIELASQLQRNYPEFRTLEVQPFGRNIALFELTIGQPMPPAASRSQ